VGDVRVEDCMKMEDFDQWLDKQEIEKETESDN
jgi:hypothetical protein